MSTTSDHTTLDRTSHDAPVALEHPKPAETSRWRLVLDGAGRRRPSAARRGDVVAAYHLGYMHGIEPAGDA